VSVLFLGTVAAVFCWLPLPKVVAGIVTIRSVIPFMAQIVGAVLLRIREPERPRPFKMWLYPLPAIVALGLWIKAALSPEKGLQWGAGVVIAVGVVFFFSREALLRRYQPAAPDPEH